MMRVHIRNASPYITICLVYIFLSSEIIQQIPWIVILWDNWDHSYYFEKVVSEEANWSGSALFAIKYVNL